MKETLATTTYLMVHSAVWRHQSHTCSDAQPPMIQPIRSNMQDEWSYVCLVDCVSDAAMEYRRWSEPQRQPRQQGGSVPVARRRGKGWRRAPRVMRDWSVTACCIEVYLLLGEGGRDNGEYLKVWQYCIEATQCATTPISSFWEYLFSCLCRLLWCTIRLSSG